MCFYKPFTYNISHNPKSFLTANPLLWPSYMIPHYLKQEQIIMPKKIEKVPLKEDYFVTGVWINKQKSITHLLLHEVDKQMELSLGEITPVQEIIELLQKGAIVRTMRWSYIKGKWVAGVLLKTTTLADGSHSVKSVFENIITDRLDHLILMNAIV